MTVSDALATALDKYLGLVDPDHSARPADLSPAFSALVRLRREAEREVERLLTLLDALDGDPDLEPDNPPEDDAGENAEIEHDEPDLASTLAEDHSGLYAPGDDLECDAGDEPEIAWLAGGYGHAASNGTMLPLNCRGA